MRALAIALCSALSLAGCGASSSQQASTVPKKQEPAAPPPSANSEPVAAGAPAEASAAAEALPANLDAGEIARDKLLAVLAAGPGRFLQRIRVKRDLDAQGRFAGWRLLELFPGEPDVRCALAPGDTLLRVNGQSVEHPEQFKTVWDSLALSSELVLTVRRAGQQSDVRYRIVQPVAPPAVTP